MAAPQAPSIVGPPAGRVYAVGATVPIQWVNNNITATTYVQVEITKPDTTTTTTTLTGAVYTYHLTTTGYASGAYSVRVRVKAQNYDDVYSAWSASRTFYIYSRPTISITLPTATNAGTVTNLPLQVGFTYTDADGSFASAGFRVEHISDGTIVYESPVSSDGWTESSGEYSLSVPVSEFLPDNSTSYRVIVTAYSTSGLAGIGTRVFITQWATPSDPNISVTAGSNATSDILYGWVSSGSPAVTSISLYRVDADGETLLDQHTGTSGTVSYTYTDRIPMLDSETTYKVCAFANSGAYSQKTANVTVESVGKSYFNWGDGLSESLALDMDLAWTIANEPKRAFYEVVGRKDPVLRTTDRRTKTLTASGSVWWDSADDSAIRQLQEMPGRVWFREPKGHRYPVAVTVSLTYPKGSPVTAVQISMTQVSEV